MPWYNALRWNVTQADDIGDHIAQNGTDSGHAAQIVTWSLPANQQNTTLMNSLGKPYEHKSPTGTAGTSAWDIMPRPFRVQEIICDLQIVWTDITRVTVQPADRIQFIAQRLDTGASLSNVFTRREGAPGMRDDDVSQMGQSPILMPRGTFGAAVQDHIQHHRIRIRCHRAVNVISTDHQLNVSVWRPVQSGGSVITGRGVWRVKGYKMRPSW